MRYLVTDKTVAEKPGRARRIIRALMDIHEVPLTHSIQSVYDFIAQASEHGARFEEIGKCKPELVWGNAMYHSSYNAFANETKKYWRELLSWVRVRNSHIHTARQVCAGEWKDADKEVLKDIASAMISFDDLAYGFGDAYMLLPWRVKMRYLAAECLAITKAIHTYDRKKTDIAFLIGQRTINRHRNVMRLSAERGIMNAAWLPGRGGKDASYEDIAAFRDAMENKSNVVLRAGLWSVAEDVCSVVMQGLIDETNVEEFGLLLRTCKESDLVSDDISKAYQKVEGWWTF